MKRRRKESFLENHGNTIVHTETLKCCSYLGGLVVRGAEAFDSDLSEDVGLQRLLSQVAVVNDGWMPKKKII